MPTKIPQRMAVARRRKKPLPRERRVQPSEIKGEATYIEQYGLREVSGDLSESRTKLRGTDPNRIPDLPPSINKARGATIPGCILSPACAPERCLDPGARVPGASGWECSGRKRLHQLQHIIRELPLRKEVGEQKIETAARLLLMNDWGVSGEKGLEKRHRDRFGLKLKRGRQPERGGDDLGATAAMIYQDMTGLLATRANVADADAWPNAPAPEGKPYGGFHNFLERVFSTLGSKARADGVNRRLQAALKDKEAERGI